MTMYNLSDYLEVELMAFVLEVLSKPGDMTEADRNILEEIGEELRRRDKKRADVED